MMDSHTIVEKHNINEVHHTKYKASMTARNAYTNYKIQ